MLQLSAFHPLAIEDTGVLAYVGRLLRNRDARVSIGAAGLLVETRDSEHAAQLRRLIETSNRMHSDAFTLVVTQPEPDTLYVTRAVA